MCYTWTMSAKEGVELFLSRLRRPNWSRGAVRASKARCLFNFFLHWKAMSTASLRSDEASWSGGCRTWNVIRAVFICFPKFCFVFFCFVFFNKGPLKRLAVLPLHKPPQLPLGFSQQLASDSVSSLRASRPPVENEKDRNQIIYNYSLKRNWLAVNIYRAAKGRSKALMWIAVLVYTTTAR